MSAPPWDETCDLVVVGSGAAGLAAALRAHDLGGKVVILEKSPTWGGSTAISGGVCWMPDNPQLPSRGIADSREDALTYLREITRGEVPEDRLVAYVDRCREVYDWLTTATHVRFDSLEQYTDYYPEAPGGRPGGRSMECPPFDGRCLGPEHFATLNPPHPQSQILGRFGITARSAHSFLVPAWTMKLTMAWLLLRWWLRSLTGRAYGRDTRLTAGNSLVARLGRSLLDRGLWPRLGWGADELVQDEASGEVLGVVALGPDGERRRLRATRGVVLAAGGFERNGEWRARFHRQPSRPEYNAGHVGNTGKGIALGMAAGGAVQLMDEAWWTPATLVPRSELAWVLVVEKNLPGGIFVNGEAQRFTNEAAPYIDVVNGMYAGADGPCFMVFDAEYRQNYICGPIAPGYAQPDSRVSRRYWGSFLHKADTLADLAQELDLDPAALQASVARFNEQADGGVDSDFGRGASAADRYYGDPRCQPNPCLRALRRPPFYAIEVVPGDLGTKGGLVTDAAARVLREDGSTIPGLFAAGNTSAAVMGRSYPGAGGTIGPALVFGYLAAEAALSAGGRGSSASETSERVA